MVMAKFEPYDPKDTWRARQEQSRAAKSGKPVPASPRQERVAAPQRAYAVTGRWSSGSPGSRSLYNSWERLYWTSTVSSFKELYPPPPAPFKFQPGDLVEFIEPKSTHPSVFKTWNDNTFVVEDSHNDGWGGVWVYLVGEDAHVSQKALRLKDGPW